MHSRMTILTHYDTFKFTITDAVAAAGGTRSALAREMEANGLLRAHTVRCLLGTPGTVIGKRKPTFDSILKIANAAGFDLILRERAAVR
jgi:DNA-binding phage protein